MYGINNILIAKSIIAKFLLLFNKILLIFLILLIAKANYND